MASLPTLLLILAAISLGAMVISILISFRSQREARSAIFPIVREEESGRARRARLSIFMWLAMTALFLGGWLATFRSVAAPAAPQTVAEAETPTAQPVQAVEAEPATATPVPPTPQPSATVAPLQDETSAPPPTATATASSTPQPEPTQAPATSTPEPTTTATPTNTAIPATVTSTATPAPPPATSTPELALSMQVPTTAPRTPAPPEAKMGPIQFTAEITGDLQAVNPTDTFSNGIETIYAVYPFSGMEKGLDFSVVWYQNGTEFSRDESEWQWGEQARSYTFIGPQGEGLYKLELYVNDSVMATGLFEVR